MTEEAQSEQQEAANVFGNLIGAIIGVAIWLKKPSHAGLLAFIVASSSALTVTLEKFTSKPVATIDKVDASLGNEAKMIASNDSTRQDVKMLVPAIGTILAQQASQQNELDIIKSDLMHDPDIMKIERARQDSVRRANQPNAFSFNH